MFDGAALTSGFAAVHALPMRLRDDASAPEPIQCVPGPIDDDTIALGQALADAATIGIVHQRSLARSEVVAEQLQAALNSRIIIEQAKGFLAERLALDVDDAFAVLRRYARDHNRKLTDLAADIISGRVDLALPPAPKPHPSR